jgi:hypothetical protein
MLQEKINSTGITYDRHLRSSKYFIVQATGFVIENTLALMPDIYLVSVVFQVGARSLSSSGLQKQTPLGLWLPS